jgi:hypothetical protein
MTGGSGSLPPLMGRLWATGLPWSSGESSDGGAAGVAETAATASLAEWTTRLVLLFPAVLDVPSSPPERFFFFDRSTERDSSSEVAVWLPAVCSTGAAWPGAVGMGPYAPGGGG